jgi:hypothetical protein
MTTRQGHQDYSKTSCSTTKYSGLVVWTSLGQLLRWVPGPTTRWALGLLNLCYTTPADVKRKAYRGLVLDKEATHVRIHLEYS